jgi:hypothetical protein
MTESERKLEPLRGRRGLQDMKVRVTGTCATNFYQHLPRSGFGNWQFTELSGLLKLDELECFHDFLITL